MMPGGNSGPEVLCVTRKEDATAPTAEFTTAAPAECKTPPTAESKTPPTVECKTPPTAHNESPGACTTPRQEAATPTADAMMTTSPTVLNTTIGACTTPRQEATTPTADAMMTTTPPGDAMKTNSPTVLNSTIAQAKKAPTPSAKSPARRRIRQVPLTAKDGAEKLRWSGYTSQELARMELLRSDGYGILWGSTTCSQPGLSLNSLGIVLEVETGTQWAQLLQAGDIIIHVSGLTEISTESMQTAGPRRLTFARKPEEKQEKEIIISFYQNDGGGPVCFRNLTDLINYYSTSDPAAGESRADAKQKCRLEEPIPRQIWEYEHKDVKLEKKLGNGEFGEAKGEVAAAKKKRKEIMQESRVMRDLIHPNVVRAYGVAVLENPMYILLELIQGGDLLKFLKSESKPTRRELKRIMFQCACGLEFIHQKEVIHRDLAARNCLYDGERLRISDFGLSVRGPVFLLPKNANQRLPIRWLAPEILTLGTFTYKTDVWAFGCLVVEIYSNGELPHAGKTNGEVKEGLVQRHTAPKMPPGIPQDMVNFCNDYIWVREKQRTDMLKVVNLLGAIGHFQRPVIGGDEEPGAANIHDGPSVAETSGTQDGGGNAADGEEKKPQPA
ncbi:unnamed protein product, partial [Mesorhabditis spiculigera]